MTNIQFGAFQSDVFANWIAASYRAANGNHPKGIFEIQSIGQVHVALRKFELSWIQRDGMEHKSQLDELDQQSAFYIAVARQWVTASFSLAYKIERGEVFRSRKMRLFKKHLNPLRNVLEKGYVDGNSDIGCFPDIFINQNPYCCIGWAVPNKKAELHEFYRVEIAEQLLELCMGSEM